jgi:hypothetical protein
VAGDDRVQILDADPPHGDGDGSVRALRTAVDEHVSGARLDEDRIALADVHEGDARGG